MPAVMVKTMYNVPKCLENYTVYFQMTLLSSAKCFHFLQKIAPAMARVISTTLNSVSHREQLLDIARYNELP